MTPLYVQRARDRAKAVIKANGQLLTVRRSGQADRYVYGMPQALNIKNSPLMMQEGGLDVSDDNPVNFIFAGTEDVAENDFVLYQGWRYRVLSSEAKLVSGIPVIRECPARRETQGS